MGNFYIPWVKILKKKIVRVCGINRLWMNSKKMSIVKTFQMQNYFVWVWRTQMDYILCIVLQFSNVTEKNHFICESEGSWNI